MAGASDAVLVERRSMSMQAENEALLQRCEALQQQVESRVEHRVVRAIVAFQAALWIGLGLTEKYLLSV